MFLKRTENAKAVMSVVADSLPESLGTPLSHTRSHGMGRDVLVGGLVGYAAAAALCGWIFRPSLTELPHIWSVNPNYSHGFLIPIAFLLLAGRQWRRVGPPVSREVSRADATAGLIRIVAGLAMHFFCLLSNSLFFDVVGLLLLFSGVAIVVAGKSRYRAYAFPLWFLIFTVQLPPRWYQTIAIGMQQIASAVSTGIFKLVGITAYREGCYVFIPGFQMEVGAACSGLRQLTAIIALSLVIGHLSPRSKFFKVALAMLSAPIAIAANCVRITLTGFILMWFGPRWAQGVYHTLEGLAVVAVAAVLILLTAWWLSRFRICRLKTGNTD